VADPLMRGDVRRAELLGVAKGEQPEVAAPLHQSTSRLKDAQMLIRKKPCNAVFAGAIVIVNLWVHVPAAKDLSKADDLASTTGTGSQDGPVTGKFYEITDGKVDARTYNGFRRYHAGCNHCHGPDGMGSTFAPSLVESLPGVETFRRIVRHGQANGTSIMKGFAADPNVAPYVDDIYAYLQARADRALSPGRPTRLER